MKTKKIIASIAITWLMLSSVSAMYDENAKQEGKWNNNEVRIMNASFAEVDDQVEKEVKLMKKEWSNIMSGSGINNASWTGVIKSEKGQTRAAEAKMKKEEAKEKMGENSDKAEKNMNKFQEKFEKKSKQEKLNQYQALWANIDRVMERFENSDISEEKKEAYRNLFEYVRTINEEKIIELEEAEEEVTEETVAQ